MVIDDLIFLIVLDNPTMCMFDPVNVGFPPSGVNVSVEDLVFAYRYLKFSILAH